MIGSNGEKYLCYAYFTMSGKKHRVVTFKVHLWVRYATRTILL
jgi:hypothetical protein